MRSDPQWEHPGSPSSASDNHGQGRQRKVLLPITLMQFAGSVEGAIGAVAFRVEVPDSRLRVKISIIGKPTAGNGSSFIGTKGLTLWLRAVEDSIQGGDAVPVTNLWGTSATPGPIPGELDNTGTPVAVTTLGGFSKEFVTAADAIVGTINYPAAVDTDTGLLLLQVSYVPEPFRVPAEEWREIEGQCRASIIGYPLAGAA
jgi:hypothetical protein